jgi:hypothetical protein
MKANPLAAMNVLRESILRKLIRAATGGHVGAAKLLLNLTRTP